LKFQAWGQPEDLWASCVPSTPVSPVEEIQILSSQFNITQIFKIRK
jgi:hypothetical protein